ncbi:MAG: polysaccharide biosynthesis protein [uncultured bacterium]|nr:MAG: polysaccharide biosynthesis protein [uncultured bacterium]
MITSETTKKIASNTVYQLIGKLVSMSVTILVTVIITRAYGREGYGEFNIMQTFPALFFIIVDFGLNAIATRELSTDWAKAKQYLANILLYRIVLSFIVMAISGMLLVFFPYSSSLKLGILLSLFLILVQSLYATTNIIFQVKLRYDFSTIGLICGSLMILALVLVLSYFKASVVWIAFTYVLGGFLTFVLNLLFIRGKLGVPISLGFDKSLFKFLFWQSLPLGLMFIFSQINFKIDSIFVSILPLPKWLGLSNIESVGVYGLPYKIFEVSLVIPTFFMNSAYPVLVKHMLEGKERLKSTFNRVLVFLAFGGILFGLIGILLSPLLIKLIGGSDFSGSVLVLQILLGGLVVFYSTQPISWLIVTLGGQKYLPVVYLISAVFNVLANLLIIPIYSFYGSAVVTIVSELIILILLAYFARKVWRQKYAYQA